MKKLACLCLFILSWHLALWGAGNPIKFAIVIPSYNNEQWCIENIESCVTQRNSNFVIIYVDDCSTDNTGKLIDDYIQTHNLKDQIFVIHNQKRIGALANLYKVINSLDPHCIVVQVDGDDKLMHNRVLEKLTKVYKDPNIWLTWGDYATDNLFWTDFSYPFPSDVIKNQSYRSYPFVSQHLKTFYAGLFQQIKKEDLLYEGNFFQTTWDIAIMLPMIEMASPNHFRYIHEVLYWYRTTNPINDFRINKNLQEMLRKVIYAKKPYKPLDTLFSDKKSNHQIIKNPTAENRK
jgi:glycosyltransferase involved in cell wall biosynthesis